ncbi:MAG TPA: pentapeptide repeat-containing protein, partial [Kofleriaceae bacterium]
RAGLVHAVFAGACLERCDLSRAHLAGTSWHRAELAHCVLRRAALTDARLDRAVFSDCDLRGADLAVVRSPHVAPLVGARFVRCDLRDTHWRGRELGGAVFVDCKLFGARGGPALAGVLIERPDLSRLGDGSRIATQSDVVADWSPP